MKHRDVTSGKEGNGSHGGEDTKSNALSRNTFDRGDLEQEISSRSSASTDNTLTRVFDDDEGMGQSNLSSEQMKQLSTGTSEVLSGAGQLTPMDCYNTASSATQRPMHQLESTIELLQQQFLIGHQRVQQQQQLVMIAPQNPNLPTISGTVPPSLMRLPHQIQQPQAQQHPHIAAINITSNTTMPFEASIPPADLHSTIPTSFGAFIPAGIGTSSLSPFPVHQPVPPLPWNAVNREPTFPMKLHQILLDPSFQDSIKWLPHGKSWRVINQSLFVTVLNHSQYFKHARLASFMRQVNGQLVIEHRIPLLFFS